MKKYIVPVKNIGKDYFYQIYSCDEEIKKNTKVVVESSLGLVLGYAVSDAVEGETKNLNGINRIADIRDEQYAQKNSEEALLAEKDCKDIVARLKLDMNILFAEYSLDRSKLLFVYTAEERVDFRGLLKEITMIYRSRIELRQIGTRDRAKIIGGVGICGMPLCCNSFLNEFDGVSINMAKNQMLTLNIQKLSGHCGKLICCLKYEDKLYSEIKEQLPKLGIKVNYQNKEYRLTSYNILSRIGRLENDEETINVSLDVIKNLKNEK